MSDDPFPEDWGLFTKTIEDAYARDRHARARARWVACSMFVETVDKGDAPDSDTMDVVAVMLGGLLSVRFSEQKAYKGNPLATAMGLAGQWAADRRPMETETPYSLDLYYKARSRWVVARRYVKAIQEGQRPDQDTLEIVADMLHGLVTADYTNPQTCQGNPLATAMGLQGWWAIDTERTARQRWIAGVLAFVPVGYKAEQRRELARALQEKSARSNDGPTGGDEDTIKYHERTDRRRRRG